MTKPENPVWAARLKRQHERYGHWGVPDHVPHYHIYDSHIGITNPLKDCPPRDWEKGMELQIPLFLDLLNFLIALGFKVTADKRIQKDYPSLSKFHRYARFGDLECDIERQSIGLKLEFYQNVSFENQNGGKYDFNKVARMPYRVRLRFLWTMNNILVFLRARGFITYNDPEEQSEIAARKIWQHIRSSGHWNGGNMLEWNTNSDYNNKDRNGNIIQPGQLKYFYDYRTRRLSCGTVYYHLNNMWYVHCGRYDYRNVAAHDLFDFDPSLPRRKRYTDKEESGFLKRETDEAIKTENYERAIQIRDYKRRKAAAHPVEAVAGV